MAFYANCGKWLEEASALKPALFKRELRPARLIEVKPDPRAFQGWSAVEAGSLDRFLAEEKGRTWSATLDFGVHCVGFLSLKIELAGIQDCPLRLKFKFGEALAEIAEDFDAQPEGLGRAWLQDEIVVLDELPATLRLPRRYAFRYVQISAKGNAPAYKIRIPEILCETSSSADVSKVEPLPLSVEKPFRRVDAIALKTLEDCMQDVFEDGPKRDRRLWLGDLRLQALTNGVSFKNFALVKRCLLLFAALARENGEVPSCLYDKGASSLAGSSSIFDYLAVYGACVLEYAEASGDWTTARELWPVVKRQAEIVLSEKGEDGFFQNKRKWWNFIDWDQKLERMTSEQGVSIFGLERSVELASKLNLPESEFKLFKDAAAEMKESALKLAFDAKKGVFTSGPEKQVSLASQIWMTLAGAVDGEAARKALRSALADPAANKPVSPYLRHFLVEAMLKAGMKDEAYEEIARYWGAMAELGADCFWEVFVPGADKTSPYGTHIMNSYCHAWSCTPSYFLRKS